MLNGKELINIVLGNIENSLVNMKYDRGEKSIQEEKNIINETLKNYIMYLNGKPATFFVYKAETNDYDILNTLARIKRSLLFIDAAYSVDISLYKDGVVKYYIKILETVDEYINTLENKKTR